MKYLHLFFLLIAVQFSFAQNLNTSVAPTPQIIGESVFLDASRFSSLANESKGLNFPRTNLTSFEFVSEGSLFGDFPTGYDGMIVYNTASGETPATGSGIGEQDVEPGFYYFENLSSSGATATGRWVRLDNGASRVDVSNSTINNTNTTITIDDGTTITTRQEKVVLLDGVAGGTNTQLVLDNTVLDPFTTTIIRLREAKIYDSSNNLLLIASGNIKPVSGSYVLVTGDGMVNKLLPTGTYQVELYFE